VSRNVCVVQLEIRGAPASEFADAGAHTTNTVAIFWALRLGVPAEFVVEANPDDVELCRASGESVAMGA
jgi:hypothetical protein